MEGFLEKHSHIWLQLIANSHFQNHNLPAIPKPEDAFSDGFARIRRVHGHFQLQVLVVG
jgi:hypothetical protein